MISFVSALKRAYSISSSGRSPRPWRDQSTARLAPQRRWWVQGCLQQQSRRWGDSSCGFRGWTNTIYCCRMDVMPQNAGRVYLDEGLVSVQAYLPIVVWAECWGWRFREYRRGAITRSNIPARLVRFTSSASPMRQAFLSKARAASWAVEIQGNVTAPHSKGIHIFDA
jgi:hypothetical protein